jgi:hypothetical protein
MDETRNPFEPGAGSAPPELAGRADILRTANLGFDRLLLGRSAKNMVFVGLRGVGKTVLLDQIIKDAEAKGILTVQIEAPERRSLPAMLAPQLRLSLLKLSTVASAKDHAVRALRALAGFAGSLKLKYKDIEVGFDYSSEPGLADNGDLAGDLSMLLEQVGLAARAAKTVVAIFIDELQYVKEEQLEALIAALHRCAQKGLPVTMIGAGLPQLRGKMGEAKSYAERLFDFPAVGPLDAPDAKIAIAKPIEDEGEAIEPSAVQMIVDETKGYPYFLQEWGKHTWDFAPGSPIRVTDVETASALAVASLDESFFRVRFDRLTPMEKKYLRAMAELGPGPHRSGDIAQALGRETSSLGPVRGSLISKGMIWSPTHGDTAFTVPLFDAFMKRIMPGADWIDGDG